MARVISEVTALLFFFMNSKAFDIKEIVPGGKVAAEIGSKLVLNCSATGCDAPTFSWRTQLDNPLGGIVSNQGSRSVLTMDPISFENEHDYLCSASCRGNNKQRTVSIHIFYGPQKTHINASSGTTLLEDGTLMLHCMTESNPPARIVWKKQLANGTLQSIEENQILSIPNIQFDDSGVYICEVKNEVTNKMENRTVTVSVQGAPRLPEFSILPSATVNEGDEVTLQCSVESSPAAQIVIRRKLASKNEILESKNGTVHIPSVTPEDAGSYECEVENKFGRRKVAGILSVESLSSIAATLTNQPEKITEAEDFDSTSVTYNTPQDKSGFPESKPPLAPKDRSSRNDTITYVMEVSGAIPNGTEEIEIIIVKTEEPSYVTPMIIGVSSVATVAGPMAAILVYISRKAKINGSYSLVSSLKAPV